MNVNVFAVSERSKQCRFPVGRLPDAVFQIADLRPGATFLKKQPRRHEGTPKSIARSFFMILSDVTT